MADKVFSLRSSALPEGAVLVGFTGSEALSRPYRFEIYVTVASADDLDDAVGASATLAINRGDGAPAHEIHGLVAGVDVLLETPEHALARLVLAPRLAVLELTLHSRIFTEKKVPEILEAILKENGFGGDDYELRLSGSYAVESHVCQYRESDFAFISRWMEREGMYYFFEQGSSVEKLVITDDRARHQKASRPPVRYRPKLGRSFTRDEFRSFRARKASRPARVVLRDYDYAKPSLAIEGKEKAWKGSRGEINLHGERFFSPGDGQRLAKLRAEELLALQTVQAGEGMVFYLEPGYLFEVEEHPVSRLNTKYLCVELRQRANLSAKTEWLHQLTGLEPDLVYEVEVVAIDATVQFRPLRVTPWPRIDGFEGGVVDGPEDSDYAQVDDQGRYHVKMQFDEGDLTGGKASTAVRMMQPHGGNPEGFHFPLRKATEVMVAFWGGDPDRPFLAGAVPNALNPSPVTAKNHTRNIIHTGGDTHIECEDLSGKQWIDIETPPKDTYIHLGEPHEDYRHEKHTHYIVENTQGDCLFDIGGNQDIDVGGELHEMVKGAVDETYKSSQTTTITGPQTTKVTAGGVTELYENLHLTVVTGDVTEEYKTGQTSTVSGGLRFEVFCTGQKTTVSGGTETEEWTGAHKRGVTGATNNMHLGTLLVHGMSTVSETYSSTVTQLWGPTTSTFASLDWKIPSGAKVTCGNFDVNIPWYNWAFINNSWTKGLKLQITAISFSAYALKISRVVASIGMYTAKVDGAGIAIAGTGLDCKVAADETENKGVRIKPKAFYLNT